MKAGGRGVAGRLEPAAPRQRTAAATVLAVALAAGAVVLAGCGQAAGGPGSSPGRHTVVVVAASSLTDALTAIAGDFEASHPGVEVQLSFAASSTVVAQVSQGAPADLVALAGASSMAPLDKSRIAAGGVRSLAGNTLEIATPPADPGHVGAISDLSRPGLKVVLCAATVPCGKAAAGALKAAGVVARVVSYETDVRATLAKVRLGEADAAIVYHSDLVSAGDQVRGVQIPAPFNQRIDYPLARLTDSPMTAELMAYLLSDQGRRRLREHGFLTAPS